MNRLVLLTIFYLTFGACIAQNNISELFKQFPYKQPGTQFKDLPNNRLYASDNDAFINIENISDMTTEQSFIAFNKADGSKIYGYRYYENGGKEYESVYSTRFYKEQKGKWVELPEILLLLGYDTFWGSTKPLPPKEYLHKFAIDYVLPRNGSTILVRLRIQPIFPEDNLDKVKLQQYAKEFRYTQIQLTWNTQKGVFELGKKL